MDPEQQDQFMMAQVEAIGIVEANRTQAEDDFSGRETACISLVPPFTAESLRGLVARNHSE